MFLFPLFFWEIALLAEKNKLERGIDGFTESELKQWKEESIEKSNVHVIEPSIDDQITSVYLSKHHKDPFDRLMVAQAKRQQLTIFTRDSIIPKYDIPTTTPKQLLIRRSQGF